MRFRPAAGPSGPARKSTDCGGRWLRWDYLRPQVPPTCHCVSGVAASIWKQVKSMAYLLQQLWARDEGQDIAEYAVMLAVILAIPLGTIRLIGSNANAVFSQVSSAIQ